MYDPERAFGVEFMDDREVRERHANVAPEAAVLVEQRTEAETATLALAMGGLAMMLVPEAPIRRFEYQEPVEVTEEEKPEVDFGQDIEQISYIGYEQLVDYEKPDTTQQALTRAAYELAA